MSDTPPAAPASTKLGWIDYVKLLFKGRAALESVMNEGKVVVDSAHKGGIMTLGFWATVLSAGAAVAAQAGGFVPPPWGAVVLAGGSLVYSISRGMVKNADPMGGVKPALTSSEAWMNILGGLGQVAMTLTGVTTPETAVILGAVHAAAISASQALAAGGAQPMSVGVGKDPDSK